MKTAVAILILIMCGTVTAAPSYSDVDALMRENPPPPPSPSPGGAKTDTVCLQTCHPLTTLTVTYHRGQTLPDGSTAQQDVVWYTWTDAIWPDAECTDECGDGSMCPTLSDTYVDAAYRSSVNYCVQTLGLPVGSSVADYCISQDLPQRTAQHCQSGSGPDGGNGGER